MREGVSQASVRLPRPTAENPQVLQIAAAGLPPSRAVDGTKTSRKQQTPRAQAVPYWVGMHASRGIEPPKEEPCLSTIKSACAKTSEKRFPTKRKSLQRAARRTAKNFVRRRRANATEPGRSKTSEGAVAILREQDETRVQELVPIRRERMAASPFAFFRGSAAIMAADLSRTPSTGIRVQACGDAHVANFGLFHSPERRLVFDINDFDETAQAPWEWDVKRLAASVEICGRERGFSEKERKAATLEAVKCYREAMRDFARMGSMDVWYAHMDAENLYERMARAATKRERRETEELFDKARSKNSARAVSKLTEVIDGELRIVNDPPLIVPLRELVSQRTGLDIPDPDMRERERIIAMLLSRYRKNLPDDRRLLVEQYRGVDIARKVVGVGSVGCRPGS